MKSSAGYGKGTSQEPKPTKTPIPEGVKDMSHSIRQIKNGYIRSSSFKNPKTNEYVHEEVYHETDPLSEHFEEK